LALVALIGNDVNRSGAVEAARAAGFSAAAMDGEAQGGFPVVWWTPRSQLPWNSPSGILAATEGVWPGVPASDTSGAVDAGPTGVPWVDANGWFVRLARARAPGRTIWLAYEPQSKAMLGGAAYLLAVADAAAYGARWVVSLDPALRAGLASKETRAIDAWRRMAEALAFFEARRKWREYEPVAALGVISDFSGPNEDFAGEVLNLLARRPLPARVLPKPRALAAPLGGLKALVYADRNAPEPALQKKLTAFAANGGLLIAGPAWPAGPGPWHAADPYGRFRIRNVGRGRLAVAKEEMQDPYLAAADAHVLLSRRHDPVRVWNGGSTNSYYTVSPDGRNAVLQVVNYSARVQGHPISVGFPERYRSARFLSPGEDAVPLDLHPSGGGIEIHLPPFPVYAAVELEK
jgi:hypothetical protein